MALRSAPASSPRVGSASFGRGRLDISGTFGGTAETGNATKYVAVDIQSVARYGIEKHNIGDASRKETLDRRRRRKKNLTLPAITVINRMKTGGDAIESVSRKDLSPDHGQSRIGRREIAIGMGGRAARGNECGAGRPLLGGIAGHIVQIPVGRQSARL